MSKIKIFDEDFYKLINLYSGELKDYSNIILEKINNHEIKFSWNGGIKYIGITEKTGSKYVQRVYAYKKTKKYGEQIMEVVRKVEGFKHILFNFNLTYNYFSGYCVSFALKSKLWDAYDKFNPSEFYDITDYENLICNDDEIKYCGYNKKCVLPFITYISYFRKCKEIEILSKLGIDYIAKYYYMLDLKSKTMNGILKLPQEWVSEILKHNVNYLNAKKYAKLKIDPDRKDQIRIYEWFYYNFKGLTNIFKPINNITKITKIYNYVLDQKKQLNETEYNCIQTYKDYLKTSLFLEKDLTDNYWLFPKNLRIKEQELLDERQLKEDLLEKENIKKLIKENSVLNKKIKAVSKKVNINIQSKEINIYIAKDIEEIMVHGNNLNICVGKLNMGYVDEMSKKRNLILFAYNENEVLECIEYDWKNNKIIQVRGKNNNDSIKHKEIIQLLNKFTIEMEKYKNIDLFAKNSNYDLSFVF